MTPHARHDKLLVQELGDELVVYDQERHRAHRLNRAAALVWRHCDGRTTVAELTALLRAELNVSADEEVVWFALDCLRKAGLLRERLPRPPAAASGISRRQVVRRLGRTAAVALLVPAVTTVVALMPAHGKPRGDGICTCLSGIVPTPPAEKCKKKDETTQTHRKGKCSGVGCEEKDRGKECKVTVTWKCTNPGAERDEDAWTQVGLEHNCPQPRS
jgi:hypothetical protein